VGGDEGVHDRGDDEGRGTEPGKGEPHRQASPVREPSPGHGDRATVRHTDPRSRDHPVEERQNPDVGRETREDPAQPDEDAPEDPRLPWPPPLDEPSRERHPEGEHGEEDHEREAT